MPADEDDPASGRAPSLGTMLKPFKTLLTYLQKGSTSSGSFDDEASTTADEGNTSSASGVEQEPEDPLADPLAFEYALNPLDTATPTTTTASDANPMADFVETGETEMLEEVEEEELDQTGEIVFVDINRLKAPLDRDAVGDHNPELFPKDDRLMSGVEKPGTVSDDTDASRSDGSDSGLGSEILNSSAAALPSAGLEPEVEDGEDEEGLDVDESVIDEVDLEDVIPVPVVSIPRLTFDQLNRGVEKSANTSLDDSLEHLLLPPTTATASTTSPTRSALKRASLEDTSSAVDEKRRRRTVQFDSVTIFYFARIQGFLCVPSVGGCTLGMEARHMYEKTMTLGEHLAEQRRAYRQQLELNNSNTTRSQQQQQQQSLSSDSSDEDGADSASSDLDAEQTMGYLRPVGTKQRRVMLKAAGVRRIEASEKDECRTIRESREVCGCRCPGGYCDPDLCYCSQNNIKCQVDRVNFPCSCTGECCGNRVGRVEFSPARVRTHYIHTKMRLDLEEKQQRDEERREKGGYLISRTAGGVATGVHSSSNSVNKGRGGGAGEDFVDNSRGIASDRSRSVNDCLTQSVVVKVTPYQTMLGARAAAAATSSSTSAGSGMILNRRSSASVTSDFQRSFLSSLENHQQRQEFSRVDVVEQVPEPSPSSSDDRVEKQQQDGASSDNQFCNNILQILDIQSSDTSTAVAEVVNSKATEGQVDSDAVNNNVNNRDYNVVLGDVNDGHPGSYLGSKYEINQSNSDTISSRQAVALERDPIRNYGGDGEGQLRNGQSGDYL